MNKNARFILSQYRRGRRFAVLRGGTRSGKTYAALQFLLLGLLAQEFKRVSVVAPTVPHLRRGALRDFLAIADPYIRNKMFRYNKVEGIIHFGNAFIEFFSTDSPDRLRGAGREVVFMNEANTHTVEAFDELEVRTEKFMILDFNPTAEFWLTERFRQMGLSLRAHEIVTTYRDNPYLPASQVRSIERRRGIADWWRVYGEGRYGEPTGVAWYNWEVGHVEERGEHILGVDFGQGSSPTAIVAVRREDGERFTAWELAYGNLSLREIADILLLRARVTPDVLIVGDSAQRDEINFLRRDGVPIVPCRKYTLAASFHLLNNVSVRISARSENLLREARSLQWADRGRGLLAAGQPDHAVDAVRYCMHEML